jgi:hypothetical protein
MRGIRLNARVGSHHLRAVLWSGRRGERAPLTVVVRPVDVSNIPSDEIGASAIYPKVGASETGPFVVSGVSEIGQG